MYSSLLKRRRCLIPATGHYEFKKDEEGQSHAYLVTLLDQPFYALAGIWSTWKTPDGSTKNTFAILTSEPNEFLSRLHDRMPVILPREHWDFWLEKDEEDPEALVEVLKPFPAENMAYWPMTKYVNNLSKNKDNALIVPSGDMVKAK
jgi:putative SOS response-associated peptidase YedK